MNKLITTLGAITLLSSGASPLAIISTTNHYNNSVATSKNNQALIKPHHKFDLWNLSTWGDTQKQIIAKSYLQQASLWYQKQKQTSQSTSWDTWFNNGYGYEVLVIKNAFNLINSDAGFGTQFSNICLHRSVVVKTTTDLATALANGIHYYVKALPDIVFTGQMNFVIKGNIDPKPTPKPSPEQVEANAIKNKITDTKFTVKGLGVSDFNEYIPEIRKACELDNPLLTASDLQKMIFTNSGTSPNPFSVKDTITVYGAYLKAIATKQFVITIGDECVDNFV